MTSGTSTFTGSYSVSSKVTGRRRKLSSGLWPLHIRFPSSRLGVAGHSARRRHLRISRFARQLRLLLGDDDLAPMEPPKTARDVRDALACTMVQVHDRKMDAKTANALAYVATSLLRAIEVSDLESRLMTLEEQGTDQWQLLRAGSSRPRTGKGRNLGSEWSRLAMAEVCVVTMRPGR
jgi:hypothetical protein